MGAGTAPIEIGPGRYFLARLDVNLAVDRQVQLGESGKAHIGAALPLTDPFAQSTNDFGGRPKR